MEVWLKSNRRAFVMGGIVLLILTGGCLIVAMDWLPVPMMEPARWLAVLLLVGLVPALSVLGLHARLPRLAYRDGFLLVYAGRLRPWEVPIEVVEVFFRGQGTSYVSGPAGHLPATAIVVRLAERAREWHEREIRSAFGRWEDAYISLNGDWCEPIHPRLLEELNHRLLHAKRQQQAKESKV